MALLRRPRQATGDTEPQIEEQRREDLEEAALLLTGGVEIEALLIDKLVDALTIGQYVMDRCLVEMERRGELVSHDGQVGMPYNSEHVLETVLTREN